MIIYYIILFYPFIAFIASFKFSGTQSDIAVFEFVQQRTNFARKILDKSGKIFGLTQQISGKFYKCRKSFKIEK